MWKRLGSWWPLWLTIGLFSCCRGLSFYYLNDPCMDGVDLDEEVRFYRTHWLKTEKPGSVLWKDALQDLIEVTERDESLKPEIKKARLDAYRTLKAKPSNVLPPAVRFEAITTAKPVIDYDEGNDVKVRRLR